MSNSHAISAGHETTLKAAELILENGGNAFDAAVAAAVTMFNSEPCMASAGAGGFAMCLTDQGKVGFLDFFAHAPINNDMRGIDFYPIEVDFGNEKETFYIGKGSTATPGFIAGIYEINRRLGSMPISTILEVPRKIAEEGVIIDAFQAIDMGLLETVLRQDESVRDIFFENGKLKSEGHTLQMPNLSGFIDMLIYEGEDEFYKGEISKNFDSIYRDGGGLIRRMDLEQYKPIWRNPLSYLYHQFSIHAPTFPSMGGGLMVLFHHMISQEKVAWEEAIKRIKKEYFSVHALKDTMQGMYPSILWDDHQHYISTKGTSHFNIKDQWGNAIAFSTSIGEGCGYFLPGTDMQLNNMLGEDFLLPNGLHSWIPDKRLNSMMTPILITDKNRKFVAAAGSGGASRIPFMIGQLIAYIFEHDLDLIDAMLMPRVIPQNNLLHFEKGYESASNGDLEPNQWDFRSMFFGGVHTLLEKAGKLEAMGDPRRYGVGKVINV